MKPLVIIPARGGSKGIPGKNIKILSGKPLINYTVAAARAIFADEVICVSTDDEKIAEVVEEGGLKVPFLRPYELATDETGTIEVLHHALHYHESCGYEPDTVILLQPTSPLRTEKHIKEALQLFDDTCDMVVSVIETKANPYTVLFEENQEGLLKESKKGNFTRRQDCPKVWELNGAIYIINAISLKNARSFKNMRMKKYLMPEIVSIDIDTILDWKVVELILDQNLVNEQ